MAMISLRCGGPVMLERKIVHGMATPAALLSIGRWRWAQPPARDHSQSTQTHQAYNPQRHDAVNTQNSQQEITGNSQRRDGRSPNHGKRAFVHRAAVPFFVDAAWRVAGAVVLAQGTR